MQDTAGEPISDVLLWTPTYGQAKAGQPAQTYIQQLCEDMGCSPDDMPEAMNDRDKWRGSEISVLAARHDDDDDDYNVAALLATGTLLDQLSFYSYTSEAEGWLVG